MQRAHNEAEPQGDGQSGEGKLSIAADEGRTLVLELDNDSFVPVGAALCKVPATFNSLVLASGNTICLQMRPEMTRRGEVLAFGIGRF